MGPRQESVERAASDPGDGLLCPGRRESSRRHRRHGSAGGRDGLRPGAPLERGCGALALHGANHSRRQAAHRRRSRRILGAPDRDVAPRRWDIDNIFKFMVCIGPISSIFDYATYAMMIWVFHAWSHPALFQTGWFVESLLTQTLIIHIIRTAKVPLVESRASAALMATSLIIACVGIALPFTPAGAALGLTPLPWLYFPLVAGLLVAYALLTHFAKVWFVQRWGM
ncbi:MAG TPA: cation transporting ATPase C-terminal domain-containing protein [Hyphomicrobiaceae bacterium]|nr:cation transporting ATPase C-terminal domain-containing protein [Hyphomicrobiaceae bacterium]